MNPFTPKLDDLTDEELLAKINELYSKLRMVMGNAPVYEQMQGIMQDYQFEQQMRIEARKQELDDNELSKKIDIGK
jgi:hypothetical protein